MRQVAYKDRLALYKERQKLIGLNHPRILISGTTLVIDLWCDGNDKESDQVFKITNRFHRLFENIVRIDK
jgi:hypothetical protein